MNHLLLLVGLFSCVWFQASCFGQTFLDSYRQAAHERWERDIEKFRSLDNDESYPDDAVLFIGSSSIRRWESISADMKPYVPIRRGYGGAKYTDLAVFAERLVALHSFAAMVVFVANDVTGGEKDTPLDELEKLVRHVVSVGQKHQPHAAVFLIEVTPTSSRFAAWEKIRRVNQLLREVALTTPKVHFVATAEYYLDDQKKPLDRFFVDDRLHLNAEGYRLWSTIIKRNLDDFLPVQSSQDVSQ